MHDFAASVCLYCGARPGAEPAFVAAARDCGTMLARRHWRLVYGAGDQGLMGEAARAAIRAGAPTMGVIPTHLMPRERAGGARAGNGRETLVITETMHERKKVMFTNADAVVVLPGGAGTLDEFFEVLTWAQIGLHAKPILLLDVAGYWQPLLALINHVIDLGFADPSLQELFSAVPDLPALEAALRAHLPGG